MIIEGIALHIEGFKGTPSLELLLLGVRALIARIQMISCGRGDSLLLKMQLRLRSLIGRSRGGLVARFLVYVGIFVKDILEVCFFSCRITLSVFDCIRVIAAARIAAIAQLSTRT